MRLTTDERIRLGMAFNNAATILGEKFTLVQYRKLVRKLYELYTSELEYQEHRDEEAKRSHDEISKKAALEAAQEIGNEDAS